MLRKSPTRKGTWERGPFARMWLKAANQNPYNVCLRDGKLRDHEFLQHTDSHQWRATEVASRKYLEKNQTETYTRILFSANYAVIREATHAGTIFIGRTFLASYRWREPNLEGCSIPQHLLLGPSTDGLWPPVYTDILDRHFRRNANWMFQLENIRFSWMSRTYGGMWFLNASFSDPYVFPLALLRSNRLSSKRKVTFLRSWDAASVSETLRCHAGEWDIKNLSQKTDY